MTHQRRAVSLIPLLMLFVAVALIATGLRLLTPWMTVNRGIFHHLQHDHDEAIAILSRAQLDPPNFRPLHYLVSSHVRIGQSDQAMELLRGVCEEYPTWAAPHYELGVLMLREGQWDDAFPWLSRALDQRDSGTGEPLDAGTVAVAEAALALREDENHRALELLAQVPSDSEETDVANLLRATALLRLNRWQEAEQPLAEAIRMTSGNPRAAAMRSLCLAANGRWHEARMWFDISRSLSVPLSMPFFFREMNDQIRLANEAGAQGVEVSAIPRDEALAFLTDLLASGQQWSSILTALEAQPVSSELRHPAIWHSWATAARATGNEGLKNEAFTRMYALNPSAHLLPDWPIPAGETRVMWSERRWTTVPLPDQGALPDGMGRYGENLEQVNIYADASLDLTFDAPVSGWYRVIVAMYGSPSNGIWPLVEISVPPAPPAVKYVATPHEVFHTAILHFDAGTNPLRVEYVNDLDLLAPDEDRAVRVTDIWVENQPIARTGQ